MSADNEADGMMFCASCGSAGSGDIKLKKCIGCYLVKYCSVKCQREHRPKHKRACKKRAAELRDEILFKQPESSFLGDCPICCLPLPIDGEKSVLNTCCSTRICNGCNYANKKREIKAKLQQRCPFCREALPKTEKEINDQVMKRIEANDPVAMSYVGTEYEEGDYKSAFEYFTKAAALGDALVHYQLSILYRDGKGVGQDKKRELHHLEQAAIGGNPDARHDLGCTEERRGRMDRAVKHFIIAAKLGYDKSLACVKDLYKAGLVSKDDFAVALRGHQAAVDATKSPQREEAAAFKKRVAERERRGI